MDCSEGGGRKLRHLLEHRGDLVGQVVGCVIIAWIQALMLRPALKPRPSPRRRSARTPACSASVYACDSSVRSSGAREFMALGLLSTTSATVRSSLNNK